ncbi:MAG: glycosyl transferase [Armatimonadota bacterium]
MGRIALFLDSLTAGGAEQVMVTLANAFAKHGHEVSVVLIRPIHDIAHKLDPPIEVVDLNARRMAIGGVRFAQYLRRHRPDALLSTITRVNGWAVMAHRLSRSSARLILREASTPSRVAKHLHTPKQRLEQLFFCHLYPLADAVVAPSRGVYHDIVTLAPTLSQSVRVIYNPVIDERLYAQSWESIEHSWFAPKPCPIILAVGRLIPDKGFDILIRAFARVCQSWEARLVILGEGEERPALESLSAELSLREFVSMPGFERNPFKYMRRADVFVLSSRREGLPNALIQAMACGCPVVSTNCPSGPEEILDGGKYGTLVPVDSIEALADAIGRVLNGERKIAPPEWLAQFEVKRISEQYLNLLLGG